MKMKRLAIALVSLGVVLVGLQQLSLKLYQSHSLEQAQHFNAHSPHKLKLIEHQGNLLRRQERWQLELDLESLIEQPGKWRIDITQQIKAWPLFVTGEWQADATVGDYASWLEQHQLEPLAHSGQWQANLLSQSIQQQFSTEDYQASFAEGDLHIKPLSIETSSDLRFERGQLEIHWQGIEASETQGFQLSISQLTLSESFSQFANAWLAENLNLQLQKMLWVNPEQASSVELEGLSLRSRAEIQANTLDLSSELAWKNAAIQQGPQQLQLSQLQLSSTLRELNVEGLKQLYLAQQQLSENPDTAQQRLIALLAKGLRLDLHTLEFTVNSASLGLVGDANFSGSAKLASFEAEQLRDLRQLLPLLDIRLNIDLADGLFNNSPLLAYILGMRQQGYLLHQEQRDRSELIFNDAEFSMNQQALH